MEGKCLVFAGTLEVTRADLRELIANAGGIVDVNVTQRTDYLVVGTQDLQKVEEKGRSRKELKAEEYGVRVVERLAPPQPRRSSGGVRRRR